MARKERRTNMIVEITITYARSKRVEVPAEMYCGNEDFSGETEQLGKLVAVLGEIVKGGK